MLLLGLNKQQKGVLFRLVLSMALGWEGGGGQFIYLKTSYLRLITPQCRKRIQHILLYT